MPKVSVVITTHSRPHLLPRAVESARAAGADVEIIVVDDASTDATAEVCRQLNGIRYVRVDRNQMQAGARNLGILASTADYISFLDDDDVRLPASLSLQVEALEAAPEAGFVYGWALYGDQDCTPTGGFYPASCPQGDIFWDLMENNFVPCPTVVFRRSCLYRVGLLDEAAAGVDDWDLWLRIAELYPVVAIEQPVAIWRRPTLTSGQASSRPAQMVTLSTRQFRRRWMRLPRAAGASAERRRSARRRFSNKMAGHLILEAIRALADGHLYHAQQNILMALSLHPLGVARRILRAPLEQGAVAGRIAGEWNEIRLKQN